MAKATITATQRVTEDTGETFNFTLPDGDVVVCGKPRGVLKLRLREILDADLIKDPEIVGIATALLCIRTIGGQPQLLHSNGTFMALLKRFGTDEQLDEFMAEYQRFTNPAVSDAIEEVLKLVASGDIHPKEMEGEISARVLKIQLAQRERVKA